MTKPIPVSVWPKPRLGLSESLEQYARRHRSTPHEMRYQWRLNGLWLLGVRARIDEVEAGLCAIAPGVSVPTKAVTEFDE